MAIEPWISSYASCANPEWRSRTDPSAPKPYNEQPQDVDHAMPECYHFPPTQQYVDEDVDMADNWCTFTVHPSSGLARTHPQARAATRTCAQSAPYTKNASRRRERTKASSDEEEFAVPSSLLASLQPHVENQTDADTTSEVSPKLRKKMAVALKKRSLLKTQSPRPVETPAPSSQVGIGTLGPEHPLYSEHTAALHAIQRFSVSPNQVDTRTLWTSPLFPTVEALPYNRFLFIPLGGTNPCPGPASICNVNTSNGAEEIESRLQSLSLESYTDSTTSATVQVQVTQQSATNTSAEVAGSASATSDALVCADGVQLPHAIAQTKESLGYSAVLSVSALDTVNAPDPSTASHPQHRTKTPTKSILRVPTVEVADVESNSGSLLGEVHAEQYGVRNGGVGPSRSQRSTRRRSYNPLASKPRSHVPLLADADERGHYRKEGKQRWDRRNQDDVEVDGLASILGSAAIQESDDVSDNDDYVSLLVGGKTVKRRVSPDIGEHDTLSTACIRARCFELVHLMHPDGGFPSVVRGPSPLFRRGSSADNRLMYWVTILRARGPSNADSRRSRDPRKVCSSELEHLLGVSL